MVIARYEAVEWEEGELSDSRAAKAASDRPAGERPKAKQIKKVTGGLHSAKIKSSVNNRKES